MFNGKIKFLLARARAPTKRNREDFQERKRENTQG
jgi:hypothetical protein